MERTGDRSYLERVARPRVHVEKGIIHAGRAPCAVDRSPRRLLLGGAVIAIAAVAGYLTYRFMTADVPEAHETPSTAAATRACADR